MNRLQALPRKQRKIAIRQIEKDSKALGKNLARLPVDQWKKWADASSVQMIECYRSRDFLVQVFQERDNLVRITACRTTIDVDTGNWCDRVTWDELQWIKDQCMFGDKLAVEIFPENKDIVNVANMRHLWVFLYDSPIDFAWGN